MSRKCTVCGRGPKKAAIRSHAKNKTLRKQHVNLQMKKIDGKKTKVCVKCLKTMAKTA